MKDEPSCDTLPGVTTGTGPSITIVDSATKGAPTALFRRDDGREFYLHSPDNPVEEAGLLVRDVPIRERTMYLVLGYGLGYHVKELLKRIPRSSRVTVIESPRACLSGMQTRVGKDRGSASRIDSRLHFLAPGDPEMVPIFLADRLAQLRLLGIELFTHTPSTMTDEGFFRKLTAEVPRQFPGSFSIHLASLDRLLENDLSNFWANLPHSWDAAITQSLRGGWSGRPLVIVSAGPSLNDVLPLLHAAARGRFLLATGTAARILLSGQIRPDLVISIDPFETNLAHFQGWGEADVPLAYYHRIHRHVLDAHKGPRFFFTMRDEPPIPLRGSSVASEFRRGGSVAFSALQLAHLLEANPVIFVGQDFAFAGGHTHAQGSATDRAFEEIAPPGEYFQVPGVGGNPVVTSRVYHSYLIYMQNYLLEYARQRPGVKHINTSGTGARISGMDYVDADRALAPVPESAAPGAAEMIGAALAKNRRVAPKARHTAAIRWAAEVDRLIRQPGRFEDFGRLFSGFSTTSACAQAARSYGDVYYLFETRYANADSATKASLQRRFLEHLRFVAEELSRIKAASYPLRHK